MSGEDISTSDTSVSDILTSKYSEGLPFIGDDGIEIALDIRSYLVTSSASTYFLRATTTAMKGCGIFPDDILIVDRALSPSDGDVVIGIVDDELLVRCFYRENNLPVLRDWRDVDGRSVVVSRNFEVWGVVKFSIRHH